MMPRVFVSPVCSLDLSVYSDAFHAGEDKQMFFSDTTADSRLAKDRGNRGEPGTRDFSSHPGKGRNV